MATLNISLPDTMKDFIAERVAESGYSTTSEYFRNLVRDDQKRRAQEKLEALLLEGIESPAREMTTEDWAGLRQRLIERYEKRTSLR